MSYTAVHMRLGRVKGKAREHECANLCGEQAQEWAYVGAHGTHSDDVDDYVALCRRCHRLLDRHANRDKTHCPHGHAYSETNTYVYPNGARKCRACRRK